MIHKVKDAQKLLTEAIAKYDNIAVGCSFGKDSTTIVHMAREIKPDIPVFSVMTPFKPQATYEYLVTINRLLNLDVTVYMVADKAPQVFIDNNIRTILLSMDDFHQAQQQYSEKIYNVNPDECCRLLKVVPIKLALKNYDAVIAGLRRSEGESRANLQPIEYAKGLTKIHPIYNFSEAEVFQYLNDNNIPLHPWYAIKFPDGRQYRSLGCEPCTCPILPHQSERMGRWQQTASKQGGECGIHTNALKDTAPAIPQTFSSKSTDNYVLNLNGNL